MFFLIHAHLSELASGADELEYCSHLFVFWMVDEVNWHTVLLVFLDSGSSLLYSPSGFMSLSSIHLLQSPGEALILPLKTNNLFFLLLFTLSHISVQSSTVCFPCWFLPYVYILFILYFFFSPICLPPLSLYHKAQVTHTYMCPYYSRLLNISTTLPLSIVAQLSLEVFFLEPQSCL